MRLINRSWNQFTKDPNNAKLTLEEQKRAFKDEQTRWRNRMKFVNSKLFNNPNIYR